MLITGTRGSGKTVLLISIEDAARQRRWLVISATTGIGIARELATTRIAELLHDHDPSASTYRTTGASASAAGFGGGAQGSIEHHVPLPELSFRSGLECLADVAETKLNSGLLVTLVRSTPQRSMTFGRSRTPSNTVSARTARLRSSPLASPALSVTSSPMTSRHSCAAPNASRSAPHQTQPCAPLSPSRLP